MTEPSLEGSRNGEENQSRKGLHFFRARIPDFCPRSEKWRIAFRLKLSSSVVMLLVVVVAFFMDHFSFVRSHHKGHRTKVLLCSRRSRCFAHPSIHPSVGISCRQKGKRPHTRVLYKVTLTAGEQVFGFRHVSSQEDKKKIRNCTNNVRKSPLFSQQRRTAHVVSVRFFFRRPRSKLELCLLQRYTI